MSWQRSRKLSRRMKRALFWMRNMGQRSGKISGNGNQGGCGLAKLGVKYVLLHRVLCAPQTRMVKWCGRYRKTEEYLYPPRVCGAFCIRCGLVVEVRALESAAHQERCLELINSLGCVLLLNKRENLLSAAIFARLYNETVADFPHQNHQAGRCVVVLAVFPYQKDDVQHRLEELRPREQIGHVRSEAKQRWSNSSTQAQGNDPRERCRFRHCEWPSLCGIVQQPVRMISPCVEDSLSALLQATWYILFTSSSFGKSPSSLSLSNQSSNVRRYFMLSFASKRAVKTCMKPEGCSGVTFIHNLLDEAFQQANTHSHEKAWCRPYKYQTMRLLMWGQLVASPSKAPQQHAESIRILL